MPSFAILFGIACLLLASSTQSAPPDPLDPQAKVPALRHSSPLARYRGGLAGEPAPWREVNDTVGRVGGWRSYLREAQQPEAGASAPHKH